MMYFTPTTDSIITRTATGLVIVMIDGKPYFYRESTRGLLTEYLPISQEHKDDKGRWVESRGHWKRAFDDRLEAQTKLVELANYTSVIEEADLILYTSGEPQNPEFPNTVPFRAGLPVKVTGLYYEEHGETAEPILIIKGKVEVEHPSEGIKWIDWDFTITGLSYTPPVR